MRNALGKGLMQLLGDSGESGIREVRTDSIVPNPRQPRKHFDDALLRELADSMSEVGVLQPLVVRQLDKDKYELIAGERRLRAAQLAGLANVPVVVKTADELQSLEIAIVENVQREDISALESAEAFSILVQEFGQTQEDIARRVGKSRSAIANLLRLLRLPEAIRESLRKGEITEGHARALLQFDTESEMTLVHARILEKGLTVREVERMAKKEAALPEKKKSAEPTRADINLESAISQFFGAPSKIIRTHKGGKIEIEFFDEEDLGRILGQCKIEL